MSTEELIEGIEVVIKQDGTLEFNAKELKILLDYITNLQEENKRIFSKVNDDEDYIYTYEELQDKVINLQKENKRLTSLCIGHEKELRTKDIIIKQIRNEQQDYKSRIDKAIEYLEQPYRDDFDYSKAELLNILNGDDDEDYIYTYEELQDKVINLQKENKHLKDLYNQALKDYDELLEKE